MVGSIFSKLFGKLVESNLSTWVESCQKIAWFQAGFAYLTTFNTIDNILVLRVLWKNSKQNKKALFCDFMEFKKIFDTVPREFYMEDCKLLKYHQIF